HAPEREPAEVIGVVEVSDLEAERRFLVSLGGRNVVVDYLEEGSEIVARFAALQPRAAFSSDGVDDREVELVVVCTQVDHEVEREGSDLVRPGVAPVDLIDDDDGLEPAR